MAKTKWAEIFTTLPDDEVVEDGEVVQFGGLGASRIVTGVMAELGFRPDEPVEVGLNGWVVTSKQGGRKIWMQITDVGDGLHVLAANERRLISTTGSRAKFVSDILRPFGEAIRRHEKVTAFTWMNPSKEEGAPGCEDPADPSVPWV